MKQYYKIIDGQDVFYKDPLIIDGMQVFNPSEAQILAAGWSEYIPVEEEPTAEELLEEAINNKLQEIKDYDESDSVNSITVNEVDLWIPADKRAVLKTSVDAYKALGIDNVTKVWEGTEYTATCDEWLYMINSVEVYASECFNTTQRHINAVKQLTTISDVDNYDYTIGYPDKLTFNIIS